MISLLFRTTLRTLSSSGRGTRFLSYSMASSADNVAPVESFGGKRHAETPLRSEEGPRGSFRFKNKRMKNGHGDSSQILKSNGTNEEILLEDVKALLKSLDLNQSATTDATLPEYKSDIEVTIKKLSSTGDGLGIQDGSNSDQVYVVPFTAPGDTVTAKVFKHDQKNKYSMADFVKVNKPSPHRDESLVKCPYFSTPQILWPCIFNLGHHLLQKKPAAEKHRHPGLDSRCRGMHLSGWATACSLCC